MTIFLSVPGRTRPMPACHAVAFLLSRGFDRCEIAAVCGDRISRVSLRKFISLARRKGIKVPFETAPNPKPPGQRWRGARNEQAPDHH